MSSLHTLYIGVAAPFIKRGQRWCVRLPSIADTDERRTRMKALPKEKLGAFDFQIEDGGSSLLFSVPEQANSSLVQSEMQTWSGAMPQYLGPIEQIVPPIDYQKILTGLRHELDGWPLHFMPRVGLTLPLLVKDLRRLRPAVVLLICHGTEEGCLLLEDGRGVADIVPGDRLFERLNPCPAVTMLAACHSELVLKRAGVQSEDAPGAIVAVRGETPIEVSACVAFASPFVRRLLDGASASDAFDAAIVAVDSDVGLASWKARPGELPPREKFALLGAGWTAVLLTPTSDTTAVPALAPSGRRRAIRRRAGEAFVGRRREMAEALDLILPLPAGVQRPGGFEPRIVTLVREGGIGKTSLATEMADWIAERELFPRGVLEIACEHVRDPAELLIRLLDLFGVEPEQRHGDLNARLRDAVAARLGEFGALLFIDNFDDLTAKNRADARRQTLELLELLLDASPGLRILATCRWPLGLPEREKTYEVPPLSEHDALAVFLAHLRDANHVVQANENWHQNSDGPTRRLVTLAGRIPQCLQLFVRQLSRPGMTLEKLRQEAEADLLRVLRDPYSDDNEQDRLRRLDVSCELSYRYLSDAARLLFQRLSFLPAGVWVGKWAEPIMPWSRLLGDGWREVMDGELVYFALARFEVEDDSSGDGSYILAPPILEFARRKYDTAPNSDWERMWAEFWQLPVEICAPLSRGYIPADLDVLDEQRTDVGFRSQRFIMDFLARTQPNWMRAHEHYLRHEPRAAANFVLKLVEFYVRTGQSSLLVSMSQQTIEALRPLDAPWPLAECLLTYGLGLGRLGRKDGELSAYAEAVRIAQAGVNTNPAAWKPVLGRALTGLACSLHQRRGDLVGARSAQQEACEIYHSLAGSDPDTYTSFLATALSNLATIESNLGNRDEACQLYEEALTILGRLMQTQFAAHAPEAARILSNLGNLMSEQRDHHAALDAYEKALPIYRRLVKDYPKGFEDRLAWVLSARGTALREGGQPDAARQAFRESLAIRRRLANDEPGRHNFDLAKTLYNLGVALRDLHEEAQAINMIQEAIAIYRSPLRSGRAKDELSMARALIQLGSVFQDLRDRRDSTAAKAAFEEAVQICRNLRLEGAEPEPELASALHYLGIVHRSEGEHYDLNAARQSLEKAAVIRRLLAETDADAYDPVLSDTLAILGDVLKQLGESERARQIYEEELDVRRRLARRQPEKHEPDLALALHAIGRNVMDMDQTGSYQAARDLFQEALDLDRRLMQSSPNGELDLADTLAWLGLCHGMLNEGAEWRQVLDEELPIRRRLAQSDPVQHGPRLAGALHRRGLALEMLDRQVDARNDFIEALALLEPHDERSPNEWSLFISILDSYVEIVPRDEQDRWWKLWEASNSMSGTKSALEIPSEAGQP